MVSYVNAVVATQNTALRNNALIQLFGWVFFTSSSGVCCITYQDWLQIALVKICNKLKAFSLRELH